MKKISSVPFMAAVVLISALAFSCTKKAETSDAVQDTTAQPADTTAQAEHPEHPAEHPADTTK